MWQETNADLPALSDVDTADPLEVCSAALGSVRQAASDLIAAPNDDLAEAFLRWSDFAESVYFKCPPADGVHAGFAASYEEMERLSAEIEALLTFEHDLRGEAGRFTPHRRSAIGTIRHMADNMIAKVTTVMHDTDDLDGAIAFWTTVLGLEVKYRDEHYAYLSGLSDRGPHLAFQQVPEPKEGKNRLHLDMRWRTVMPSPSGSSNWVAASSRNTISPDSSGSSWPTPRATSSASTRSQRTLRR